MQTHELNTLPEFWHAVVRGEKTFEVRENDRGFQTGDLLRLKCFLPGELTQESSVVEKRVSYVLSGWGLKNGYVVLGLADAESSIE